MTIRIDPVNSERITSGHTSAADGIDDLASSIPKSVDGGEGAPDLVGILSVVADASGTLAMINRASAEMVLSAILDIQVTDDDVAATFGQLASEIR